MVKINWLGIIIIFIISVFTHGKSEEARFKAPLFINYNKNEKINMNVTFNDLPAGSYKYIIQYKLSHKDANETGEINATKQYILIRNHNNMVSGGVRISVELYNYFNEKCSALLIYEGKVKKTKSNNICFSSKGCQVLANFPKNCTKDQLGFKINCTSNDDSYDCSSRDTLLQTNTYLHWYQYYANGSIFGNVTLPNTTKSYFSFTLEDFDNNSYINSTISDGTTNNAHILYKSNVHEIRIPGGIPWNKTIHSRVEEKKYSENKLFSFSCTQYLGDNINVQVAIIVPSTNTIKPSSLHSVNMTRPAIELNGSILCCLIYDVNKVGTGAYIKRRVEKKTLLVYEQARGIQLKQMFSSGLYSIIMAALIFLILTVIGIIIFRKWRKKRDSRPTVELDTYACPDRIVYAELNVNQESRQPLNQDESPYAEIAGVLKSKQVHLFR